MIGVTDKIGSRRWGLFAKYVIALVGLVVFVLAVNGALETWISYRATKATLTDAMAREGGGDRAADRAIDRRAGAPDQLGDPRQRRDSWNSTAPTTPSCSTRSRRSAQLSLLDGERPRAASR